MWFTYVNFSFSLRIFIIKWITVFLDYKFQFLNEINTLVLSLNEL